MEAAPTAGPGAGPGAEPVVQVVDAPVAHHEHVHARIAEGLDPAPRRAGVRPVVGDHRALPVEHERLEGLVDELRPVPGRRHGSHRRACRASSPEAMVPDRPTPPEGVGDGAGLPAPRGVRIGTFGPARARDVRRTVESEVIEVTSELARTAAVGARDAAHRQVGHDVVARSVA